MLLSREPLRDRLARRMEAAKAAKAAAKKPNRREEDQDKLDAAMHRGELVALDRHLADVRKKLTRSNRGAGGIAGSSSRHRELERELAALPALRNELVADHARPITQNRDGSPLAPRLRAVRRMRAAEVRDQLWRAAERLERQDPREARRKRCDALRARHIVEYELGWRTSLRGFTH